MRRWLRKQIGHWLCRKAARLIDEGEHKRAFRVLYAATMGADDDQEAVFYFSHALRTLAAEKQRLGDSLGSYRLEIMASRFSPRGPVALYERGLLFEETGAFREAMGCYCEAERGLPGFLAALVGLARCSLRVGRDRMAQDALNRAVLIARRGHAPNEVAALLTSLASAGFDRREEVINALASPSLVAPSHCGVFHEVKIKRPSKDIPFQESTPFDELRREIARSRQNLGRILVENDWAEDGIGEFEKVLGADSDDALTRLNLGLAFVKQDRYAEALEQIDAADRCMATAASGEEV